MKKTQQVNIGGYAFSIDDESYKIIDQYLESLKRYYSTNSEGKEIVEDIEERLGELLAENVHDVWALGRIREGWTYGERRDDALRQTPCLVPYDELPESEKDFDRNTAMNTIKAILALGFRIEKE